MALRDSIVHTRLGGWAQSVRATLTLHRTVHNNLESLGTEANDELARWLLERICPTDGVFVDVGAHIGSVIAGAIRHARPKRMIAIEAIPDKVAKLRQRFPTIEIHECAVGATAGNASFFIDLAQSGYSSLRARHGETTREIHVRVRTLDDVLADVIADVVKIDVEGAELDVLRGAEAFVAQSRPTIMFESAALTPDAAAIWAWFDERNYEILVPNRLAHLGPALTSAGFDEAHVYPRRTMNYFALPRERREDIRDHARLLLGVVPRDD